jgi:adenylate cyclase
VTQHTTRLAAVVFTDIVGYSAVVHRDPALGARLLDRQREVVRSQLRAFAGREVETAGDSFLLEFESAVAALQYVATIHRQLHEVNAASADGERVVLRASIHLGDVEHRGDEIFGDGVNVSARLLPLSPEGGVALSDVVHRQVHSRLNVPALSIGRQSLKNIAAPMEVFTLDGAAVRALQFSTIPAASTAQSASRERAFRRFLLAAVAIAIFAVLAVKVAGMRLGPRPETDRSVAVLPLLNQSGDPAGDYFSDGLSEDLITALAQSRDLKVIGRTSSFQFKGGRDGVATIGAKLNVAHLLQGTVRRQGDRVRIVAELVRVSDEVAVWAQTYDRELKDVFAVQSEIAHSVAMAMRVALAAGDVNRDEPPSGNLAAYDALLRGNYMLAHQHGEDGIRQAVSHYERAIALDPDYALAYARLADALTSMSWWMAGEPYIALLDKAQWASDMALKLAPDLGQAHLARGRVLINKYFDFDGSLREYRIAHEIMPGDPAALGAVGSTLVSGGQLEEGFALLLRGIELDPYDTSAMRVLAWQSLVAGRNDEAERYARQVPQPAFIAVVAARRGRFDEALAEARREPNEYLRLYALAYVHISQGDRTAADQVLRQMTTSPSVAQTAGYQIGSLYARRGEPDRAFEWLERAYEAHDGGLGVMTIDVDLKSLRADPRFAPLAKRLGLDWKP